MKTIKFIAAAVMCLLSLTANAQTTMRIEFEDGKQVDYPASSIASIKWFSNETTPDTPTTPDISPSGVQAVDLGLSVKWANMNVGATSMEDYGDYFAWGETVGYNGGKKIFDDLTYKYYYKSTSNLQWTYYTKYITKSDATNYGYDGFFYDDKTILDPKDDAAVANWGGSWRMPTMAEQNELFTKCTWEWKELNGKKGYKVIGPNGNFIFLPAAGLRQESVLFNTGSYGAYWSSSLNPNSSYEAYDLDFYSNHVQLYINGRFNGQPVRAVCP